RGGPGGGRPPGPHRGDPGGPGVRPCRCLGGEDRPWRGSPRGIGGAGDTVGPRGQGRPTTYGAPAVTGLETHLRQRRDLGRPLLVPYVMAGITGDWTRLVCAMAGAGADAVEVGLPFSDPMVDGPTLQQ